MGDSSNNKRNLFIVAIVGAICLLAVLLLSSGESHHREPVRHVRSVSSSSSTESHEQHSNSNFEDSTTIHRGADDHKSSRHQSSRVELEAELEQLKQKLLHKSEEHEHQHQSDTTKKQQECSGADFYSWTHPDASPPTFLTDRNELLRHLADFIKYYAAIPPEHTNKYLRGGMQMEHQFTAWAIIRAIQPLVVIESGLWRGLGSRLIRHAAPDAMLYFFDPLTEPDRYHAPPPSQYYEGKKFVDLREHNFLELSHAQRRRSVILSDDHFGILERLQAFVTKGFVNSTVIWDDNYATDGEGSSNFSPKQLILKNECQWRPIPDGAGMSFQQVHYSMIASPRMMSRKQRLPRMRISKEEVERRRQQYRALLDWYVEVAPPYPQWPQSQQIQKERDRLRRSGQVDRDATWAKREAPAIFSTKEEFWAWAKPLGLHPDMKQTKWAGQLSNQMAGLKIHDFKINPADIRPVQDCQDCKEVPADRV